MSFTQDELQSLNTIFEQKLSLQRRELERTFDQHTQTLRREFEHKLSVVQQDLLRNLTRRLLDQQNTFKDAFYLRFEQQQTRSAELTSQEIDKDRCLQRQHFESLLERSLATQLLGFEQLINKRLSSNAVELAPLYTNESQGDFDAIEVQTEIPWEDLVELIEKVLDERLALLNTTIQAKIKDTESLLIAQIHNLREVLISGNIQSYDQALTETMTNMQDIFTNMEQLGHIVESMQVAMTANSALLSNRLYHHQQLPLERAHSSQRTGSLKQSQHENTTLSSLKKHESD